LFSFSDTKSSKDFVLEYPVFNIEFVELTRVELSSELVVLPRENEFCTCVPGDIDALLPFLFEAIMLIVGTYSSFDWCRS